MSTAGWRMLGYRAWLVLVLVALGCEPAALGPAGTPPASAPAPSLVRIDAEVHPAVHSSVTALPGETTKKPPAWVADAIFYQIFPERFANGDSTNDPTRESLEAADTVPKTWAITPWTGDW